jgi:hypothetical protein
MMMSLKKRGFFAAILAVLLVCFGGLNVNATDLYVAPDGDDANPGTKEKPFATLVRARDAVRALKKNGLPGGGVTVWLKGGTYELTSTFELGTEDSGTKEAPIVYRGVNGEDVRISGGQVLPGTTWKQVTDKAVLNRLPEEARGKVFECDLKANGIRDFGNALSEGETRKPYPLSLELFSDDQPMQLARWPNQGFAETGRVLDSGPPPSNPSKVRRTVDLDKLRGTFTFENQRLKRWVAADLWVMGYWRWDWACEYLPVEKIDPARRTITVGAAHIHGIKEGKRFYVLNLLEELDRPGEWYLDCASGKLYFWPTRALDKARITVSVLDRPLISLKGCSYVTLRSLILEAGRGHGCVIRNGHDNLVEDCVFRNLGGWAARIGVRFQHANTVHKTEGGTRNGLRGCEIFNVGEGGVVLSGGDRITLTPGRNFVEDCDIHHFGRLFPVYRAGVDMAGVGNRVAHNHIHDAPHTGIFFWGNDHVIEFNELSRLCTSTADAGAVYIGRDWSMRGNILRYNFIHDLGRFSGSRDFGGTMAVYLDDFASGTTVYGNVIANAYIGVMIGGGHDNHIENNIWVNCRSAAVHVDARGLVWAKKCFDGKYPILFDRIKSVHYDRPPYSTRYPRLAKILEGNPAAPRGNRIRWNVCSGGRWTLFRDGMNEQKAGVSMNAIIRNPGFVDPTKGDYRLKANSPALKQLPDFKPIPFDRIGPRTKSPSVQQKKESK